MKSLGKKFIHSGYVHLLMGVLLIWGCGGFGGLGLIMGCSLPQDQLGTLQGKWQPVQEGNPIPVALSLTAGGFNATERELIGNAIQSWNTFYGNTLKIEVLSPQSDTSTSPPVNLCSQSQVTSQNQFNSTINIYKDLNWIGADLSVVAITTLCPTSGEGPIRPFVAGQIELNYRTFFVEGAPNPGLEETILHELGHLLGLGHSCEFGLTPEQSESQKIPSCTIENLPSEYKAAIMFPTVNLSGPSGKTFITPNDQGRANCLYTDFST